MPHKTLPILLAFLLASTALRAQETTVGPTGVITGVFLGETPPLRELPVLTREEWQAIYEKAEKKALNPKIRYRSFPYEETALPKGPDAVWQKEMGSLREDRAPMQSFNGTTSPAYPPDANGTIGPEHYMQTINTVFTIFNRAGAIVAGPTKLNTLFYGLAGATNNDGDPIVLYDEQADRWLMGEFSITSANDYMLIAVSTTNDPTGTWYKYSFDVSETPDYEKFGIWRDGYYMGTNTGYSNDIYVFQRDSMLTGQMPMGVMFDNPWRPAPSNVFNCVPPLDNDGDFAPAGEPGLFIAFNDDAVGGGSDQLWIYELDVDWSAPASSTFSRTQQISVSGFDSNFGTDWSNIKQLNTAQELDAIPQVIMNPPQYRNFGAYETIVCCHTVDVDNTDHAGIRWYELRRVSSGDWSIRQLGTYAPDGHSRWMASIMLNGAGEIGLGYSISSSTMYPGIRYCGQSASAYASATGTMDVAEDIIQNGDTCQQSYNRWGDYSSLQIDPTDDETFWFTSQYPDHSGSVLQRKTKIANFQIGTPVLTANFAASNTNPQTYALVNLTDASFGSPASWTWTISPGTFNFIEGTTASSQHPKLQFTAAGDYSVILKVTSGANNDTESKTNYIHVIDCGYQYLPFNEDFSDGVIPACWKTIDSVGNGHVWRFDNPGGREIKTPTGTNGVAILDSYYYGINYSQNADLITPMLDLSAYTSVNLSFQHYMRAYVTTPPYSALGKLYYSLDDGCTWAQLGSAFAGTPNPYPFNQNVTQVAGQSRVRFKWNYSGYGYYWAIDDISITGTGPNVWTGTTSTSWSTDGNWSTGTAPTATSNVIIPVTATNWPTITGEFALGTTCDKMTLYGGSQLNVSGNVRLTNGKKLIVNGSSEIALTGDWIIEGGTFIPGSGTVKFTGNSASSVISSSGVSSYIRSTFTKGMTDLTSPVNSGPNGDDKSTNNINIGFTFNYHGANYNYVQICSNGWLSFETTASTTPDNTILFNTSPINNMLAPWFDDLNDDNTSTISYKLEGNSPNRVFTAEWKGVHVYQNKPGAKISFQVKLFETTNVIEFHYGNLTGSGHSIDESASIGIEDGTGSSGHFIEATTGSTTTGITNLVSTTQWPTVNYRFTPPSLSQTFSSIAVDKSGSSLTVNPNSVIRGNLTITNGTFIAPGASSGTLTVTGNWSNSGTFTPGSGTIVLAGSSNQNVGGNNQTTFSNLTLNNAAGVTLQRNQTVSGTLTMTSGNIDCGAYTLELGTSASATGSLAWTSGNIAGSFKRWIALSTATPVEFPVGTATANHKVRITFSNNTGGSLTARFEPGNPGSNSGFPLAENGIVINENNLYTEGSWTLVPTTLSSTAYALELTGTGFSSVGPLDETVRILKRTDGGGPWLLQGTHVAGTPPVAKRSGFNGFSRFILAKPCNIKISGSLAYYNNNSTPLTSGITMKLFRDGLQVGSNFNVTSGMYEFTGLCPGTYEIQALSGLATDGSINSSDAAQVNYWGTNPYAIEKVRFYAGDVTGSGFYINSSDAQRIQANFVYGTAFDRQAWTFWKTGETISSNSNPVNSYPVVSLTGGDVVANIYGLCTGDFNRSYIPSAAKTKFSGLMLIMEGEKTAVPGSSIELPVKITAASVIGAISLVIDLPEEIEEITDVVMKENDGRLDWAVDGRELRIGWNTSDPIRFEAGEILLNLQLKTNPLAGNQREILLTLADDPRNELADENYNGIEDAVLKTDLIRFSTNGINDPAGMTGLEMVCSPNPFSHSTKISYTLPSQGKVSLEISNLLGIRIATLVNEEQAEGNHMIGLSSGYLPGGVYIATLCLDDHHQRITRSIRLLVNK